MNLTDEEQPFPQTVDELLDFLGMLKNLRDKPLLAQMAVKSLLRSHDLTIEKKLLEALPGKITKCSDECGYGKKCRDVITHNETLDEVTAAIKSVFRGRSNGPASTSKHAKDQRT